MIMKQKKYFIAILAAMLLTVPAMAQRKQGKAAKAKTVEVSFDYQKQPGPGSNQYAVWIGNFVHHQGSNPSRRGTYTRLCQASKLRANLGKVRKGCSTD